MAGRRDGGSFIDIEVQAGGATIAGPGTTTLSGANARIVAISGAGPFTFEDGALQGNGRIVTNSSFNGATISPGMSIGSLSFVNSDTTFVDTTIRHEIQSVIDDPGVTADLIDVGGSLDLRGVTVELVSLDANGLPGDVFDFDPNADDELVIAIANEITGLSGASVDLSEFTNTYDGSFIVAVVPRGNRHALVLQSSDILKGDVNQDGIVNLLDVGPFIDAIAASTFVPPADVNCDGIINLLDVGPFIDVLSGG